MRTPALFSGAVEGMDVVERLLKLHNLDRVCDRLQKRLDQVPIKLKVHTDTISGLERELAELDAQYKGSRAAGERHELEVATSEGRRDKVRQAMNAPKLSSRQYTTLQEEMAGLLSDISSSTDKALVSLDDAKELENQTATKKEELAKAKEVYEAKKAELEGALGDVRADLETRTKERAEYSAGIDPDPKAIYERVRRKHKDALAVVDGTIDRAVGRIGNDLHCSSCYMTITANDAVQVLARAKVIQCKSCVRILYVA